MRPWCRACRWRGALLSSLQCRAHAVSPAAAGAPPIHKTPLQQASPARHPGALRHETACDTPRRHSHFSAPSLAAAESPWLTGLAATGPTAGSLLFWLLSSTGETGAAAVASSAAGSVILGATTGAGVAGGAGGSGGSGRGGTAVSVSSVRWWWLPVTCAACTPTGRRASHCRLRQPLPGRGLNSACKHRAGHHAPHAACNHLNCHQEQGQGEGAPSLHAHVLSGLPPPVWERRPSRGQRTGWSPAVEQQA
jgi:hypothetical protein